MTFTCVFDHLRVKFIETALCWTFVPLVPFPHSHSDFQRQAKKIHWGNHLKAWVRGGQTLACGPNWNHCLFIWSDNQEWFWHFLIKSDQSLSHVRLCDPMNHSTPGLLAHHQLLEFTQTHVHWVGDAIQPSHPLSSPSLPAPNPSQHQGLFQWVNSLHKVAKVLEFQLQHQSFQWTPRTDLL